MIKWLTSLLSKQNPKKLDYLQLAHKKLEEGISTKDFYHYIEPWIENAYRGNKEQWLKDTRCLLDDRTLSAFGQYILNAHSENALGKIIQKHIPRSKITSYTRFELLGDVDINDLHSYDYTNKPFDILETYCLSVDIRKISGLYIKK